MKQEFFECPECGEESVYYEPHGIGQEKATCVDCGYYESFP